MIITATIPFEEAPTYLEGLRFESDRDGNILIYVTKTNGSDAASVVVTRADFARILELV